MSSEVLSLPSCFPVARMGNTASEEKDSATTDQSHAQGFAHSHLEITHTPRAEEKRLSSLSPNLVQEEEVVCCCMDATLCYFRMFHMVCGLVVALNLVENCIVLAKDFSDRSDIRDLVMRLYDVIFCMLCIFIEMDLRYVVDHIKLMDNWIFRGE